METEEVFQVGDKVQMTELGIGEIFKRSPSKAIVGTVKRILPEGKIIVYRDGYKGKCRVIFNSQEWKVINDVEEAIPVKYLDEAVLKEVGVEILNREESYARGRITLNNFLKLQPYDAQKTQEFSVRKMMTWRKYNIRDLGESFVSPTNPLTITYDGKIVQGNHRRYWLSENRTVEQIGYSFDRYVPINILYQKPVNEVANEANGANGQNTHTNTDHHIIFAGGRSSAMVFFPIWNIMQKLTKLGFTERKAKYYSNLLAYFLHKHPNYFDGNREVHAYDIYLEGKGESKTYWKLDDNINIDLRAYADRIEAALERMFEVIQRLRDNGDLWNKKLGKKHAMFLYLLIAFALNGKLSSSNQSKLIKFVDKSLNEWTIPGGKTTVFRELETFSNHPKGSEDAILQAFRTRNINV